MTPEAAEITALNALTWIVGEGELADVFLGTTGASQEDLKTQVTDPAFLASVLDFLMMDDKWVITFCDANGMAYDEPGQARMALPGQGLPHWT
ncbi:MAG: DUF3572 domain-containing protein [Pseudomonadota bacterium]